MSKLKLKITKSSGKDRVITKKYSAIDLPKLKVSELGISNLDELSEDLLDLATAIYFIERNLPGNQHINRIIKIEIELGMRYPEIWTSELIQILKEILLFMGGIHWEFKFFNIKNANKTKIISQVKGDCEGIVLFSGGLDSLSGASICDKNKRLMSYYHSNKNKQIELALSLGHRKPVQWAFYDGIYTGRSTTYFYRSFLFLTLATVTAKSYNVENISQYENGILACGLPPSVSGRPTKHAHHIVHRLCEKLFNELFGKIFTIENPSKYKTKKESFVEMRNMIGIKRASFLASKTESCWHPHAGYKNKKLGKKPNGKPCGFCVPCIIRETAAPQKPWINLKINSYRNDPIYGHFFREYYLLLKSIQITVNKPIESFYSELELPLHDIIKPRGGYEISELKDMFLRFSNEFMQTYNIR